MVSVVADPAPTLVSAGEFWPCLRLAAAGDGSSPMLHRLTSCRVNTQDAPRLGEWVLRLAG